MRKTKVYNIVQQESKMTAITLHTSKLLTEVTKLISDAKEALQERARVKQVVRELSALSDRELNDMGICRGDIYGIAKGDVIRGEGWMR